MAQALSLERLSKRFLINHTLGDDRSDYRTLRETLGRALRSPWHNLRQGAALGEVEEFWALQDVSFEVREGDVLGIIGRNGAGKSTLLKILTRISAPTSGRARIHGRVGSLLEVGTGFHPELTGRENVFLNGSILGMRRREIKKKFDQIVDFSGVEKFLDTPVKRYSSGMKVRLAFAVAAHLDLEVLLIDEVLAVGDAEFQRKCLGKMDEVANGGRTILFVSHNMGAVSQLCPRCVWLDHGSVRQIGDTRDVVSAYLSEGNACGNAAEISFEASPDKEACLRRLRLLNSAGDPTTKFDCDNPVIIEFLWEFRRSIPGLYGFLDIMKKDGTRVMISDSFDVDPNPLDGLPVGMHCVKIVIPSRSLAAGDYLVYVSLASPSAHTFNVDTPGIVCGFSLDDFTSRRGNKRPGFFSTCLQWEVVSHEVTE